MVDRAFSSTALLTEDKNRFPCHHNLRSRTHLRGISEDIDVSRCIVDGRPTRAQGVDGSGKEAPHFDVAYEYEYVVHNNHPGASMFNYLSNSAAVVPRVAC